jgi:hypothetical protein
VCSDNPPSSHNFLRVQFSSSLEGASCWRSELSAACKLEISASGVLVRDTRATCSVALSFDVEGGCSDEDPNHCPNPHILGPEVVFLVVLEEGSPATGVGAPLGVLLPIPMSEPKPSFFQELLLDCSCNSL